MALTPAQLLDELMGRDRNLVPGEKSTQVHWSHEDVCKNFLCGFCPHDLFVNTKADLGPCSKIHDDVLKTEYSKSSRHGRMGYEEDFVRFLSDIQSDVERKIFRGHDRLKMNKQKEMELARGDSDKVKMLTDHINQLVTEIETLGSEGRVEEARGVTKLLDQLKEEREQHKENAGVTSQEKQMEVCEVCGAFLIVGDAQSRVDDHLQGKQHVGYAKIKSSLEELKSRPWLKRKDDRRESKSDRDRERDRDRDRERKRSKERRSRDRSRERRHRSRSRERTRRRSRERSEKDRERRRSPRDRDSRRSSRRSRSRSPRDKSHRRSRSRERESSRRGGSKDRESRRRSRSRERVSRKRSRSQDAEKSRNSSKDRNSEIGSECTVDYTVTNENEAGENQESERKSPSIESSEMPQDN